MTRPLLEAFAASSSEWATSHLGEVCQGVLPAVPTAPFTFPVFERIIVAPYMIHAVLASLGFV